MSATRIAAPAVHVQPVWSRRRTLGLMGAACSAVALPTLQGCATSPVTGAPILAGMSEEQERKVDQQAAPHQFASDLGPIQDARVNQYVVDLGTRMQANTHRPTMPYSYRVLNANHVNAYTFPGGAMAVTRGILVELNNEAELAALLGHEQGHVNARHAAQRQGAALVAQVAVVGLAVASSNSRYQGAILIGSQIGASALLASYSRENEREADALGQQYMVRAGYPASGMTALHQMLVAQEKERPSALETMFSSHPMSTERRDTAERDARERYAASLQLNPQRERFMDTTAPLRAQKPVIEACSRGESAMARKRPADALTQFQSAIARNERDYAAQVRTAQCLTAMDRRPEALRHAELARQIYPQEATAHKVAAVLRLADNDAAGAAQRLEAHQSLLPGDPGVSFLLGRSYESLGQRDRAAAQYQQVVSSQTGGEPQRHAAQRLREWGR